MRASSATATRRRKTYASLFAISQSVKRSIRWPPCVNHGAKATNTLGIVQRRRLDHCPRMLTAARTCHAGAGNRLCGGDQDVTSQITHDGHCWRLLMGAMRHLASTRGTDNPAWAGGDSHRKWNTCSSRATQLRPSPKKYCEANSFPVSGAPDKLPHRARRRVEAQGNLLHHAEGYPAAEMKHGPIALVRSAHAIGFLCPKNSVYEKSWPNIEEVKARKGTVIVVATEGDEKHPEANRRRDLHSRYAGMSAAAAHRSAPATASPYHIAVLRGCDVDKPRNLAKRRHGRIAVAVTNGDARLGRRVRADGNKRPSLARGLGLPQFRHFVTANCIPQCGQFACVTNMCRKVSDNARRPRIHPLAARPCRTGRQTL